ncbi:MAG: hypothetical protein R3D69_07780 [Xanthobacteraceae bacterium]
MAVEARARRGQRSSAETEPAGQGDRLEAAEFIGSSVEEFAQLARRHSLETLAYLLDMVRMEAAEIVRQCQDRQRK